MWSNFNISHFEVSPTSPCFIIAEIGLAHEGSLGMAHSYIDAVSESGANAVKFQTHIASEEGTKEEKFRVKVFPQDDTRQDYWRRTSFTTEQWFALKNHAEEKGLIFLSTPFSEKAFKLLDSMDIQAWKVGSGETNNYPLLEKMAKTRKPILLSTGMSYIEEVDLAVETIKKEECPIILFQCTNRYPCPAESIGLNVINEFKEKYNIPIGLSDHSSHIGVGIAAATLGIKSLEVHVTFHKNSFGPDVKASLTIEELGLMTSEIRFIEKTLSSPVDKKKQADSLSGIRDLFTKSIVTGDNLKKGHVLKIDDLLFKKPGTGLHPKYVEDIVGKQLLVDLPKDSLIKLEHFDA